MLTYAHVFPVDGPSKPLRDGGKSIRATRLHSLHLAGSPRAMHAQAILAAAHDRQEGLHSCGAIWGISLALSHTHVFIGSLAWVCLAPYPIRISCTDTLLAPLYGRAHSRPRAPLYWGLLKGYVLGAVRLALRLFPRDLSILTARLVPSSLASAHRAYNAPASRVMHEVRSRATPLSNTRAYTLVRPG